MALASVLLGMGALALGGAVLLRGGSPVIAEIAVVGGERIDTAQVRTLSLLRVGERWTPGVRERALHALRALPSVRNVELSLQPLRRGEVRVVLTVQEREPFGLLALTDGIFWVDPDGYVLEPASRLSPPPGFPVVEGVSVEETPQGRRVVPEESRRLLRAFFGLEGPILARVERLRLRPYDLELELYGGKRVLLPRGDLPGSVERLRRVIEALEAADKGNWRVLDLRVEGEATLRR